MKRIIASILIILAGLVIGLGVGTYSAFAHYAQGYSIPRFFASSELAFSLANDSFERRSGDAKALLLKSLATYESGMRSSIPGPMMKNAMRMRTGLIKARLSVLEKEAGNIVQSNSYMAEAQADFKTVGWIDTSETRIMEFATCCRKAKQSGF